MSWIRNWKIFIAAGMLLVLVAAGASLFFWYGPGGKTERVVMIPLRSGTASIAKRLKEGGVIRSARVFRYYAALTGQARLLKAGEYAFAPGISLRQVVGKLADGDVITHPFTIPEGFTAAQIAERLETADLVSKDAFLAVVENKAFAQSLDLPSDRLEGFLFPDTYRFTRGMTAEQIAKRMVENFRAKVTDEMVLAGQEQGLGFLELITLASIIEREVKADKEREVVASVFYNRLRKKKRLESCATVLYAQGRTSGALSLEDLQFKSPYNTYRHRGLPPGPIGNPGLPSIKAAAYPQETDYLFFVVRPDGTHVFSEDFEAHKKAKWRQKRKRKSKSEPETDPATP